MNVKKGFTLIETIVVIGIFLALVALTVPNILNFRSASSLNTTTTSFVTELKNQQVKAMTGDTEGSGTPQDYGIYIDDNSYTVFRGNTFDQNEPSNFSITIDSNYELSTTFPSGLIIFGEKNGEIVGFTEGQNTITIREKRTGQQKIITLNKYGVISSIN